MSFIGDSPSAKRVRFTPQSADPVNPQEGDLQFADGTARQAGLWQYLGGAWAQLAAGPQTPAGSVVAFAGAVAPAGWLLCDGSAISRTTFSSLFAAIGTANGIGNGSTTFNLPDYRGQFLRGVSGASTKDPDRASRTAMAAGGNAGNNVGSVQDYQVQSHSHSVSIDGYNATSNNNIAAGGLAIQNTKVFNTAAVGGNETRPTNAYVNWIIKT